MEQKKYKIGYTTGVFDMFHIGHLNILKSAKEQCEYLIVGVTTDDLCMMRKKKRPIIGEDDRIAIVSAIRYVDEVIRQESMDKLEVVKNLKADVVFVGSDWKGTDAWNQYEKDFSEAAEKLRAADLILFAYPVYTFLVPAQLHRFVELMKGSGIDFAGKYATQITTSKHFYDVTAQRFLEDNFEDMGLRYVRGLSARKRWAVTS